jgi:hypothetical protein
VKSTYRPHLVLASMMMAATVLSGAAGASEPLTCANPASVGTYSVTLVGGAPTRSGDLVTYTYQIANTGSGGSFPALSHGVLGVLQIDCIASGANLSDLIVKAELNGETISYTLGVDPFTGLNGVKIDNIESRQTDIYAFTFDESKLGPEYRFGVGCVDFATKGGTLSATGKVLGPVCELRPIDDEPGAGCTPGYWKQPQHFGSWDGTGYERTNTLVEVFGEYALPGNLLQALSFRGGNSSDGAKQILLRAAVAAILNAGHPEINYPLEDTVIVNAVKQALQSGERVKMLDLAGDLDDENNLGCPLSRNEAS